MIVMSGWKIYPTEVEEVLIKYPAVKEIAIFSINDCHRGEIPVAAVVWENEEDSEGLIGYARENLSRYKVPKKITPIHVIDLIVEEEGKVLSHCGDGERLHFSALVVFDFMPLYASGDPLVI